MSKWGTVLTVSYPQQLWIIRTKLESEGIECFIKDELTVQSYNLYSNAAGGVKLQVLDEAVERARAILTELGYINEETVEVDLLTRIDAKTRFIPILKNVSVVNRIIILAIAVVTLITTSVYFICRPSLVDLLTKNAWIVEKIYYKNKLVGPKSTDSLITPSGVHILASSLGEFAEFRDNNYLSFPGIQSREIHGKWEFIDQGTIMMHVDTLKDMLEGSYDVDISENNLILKSTTTTIYAHQ